MTEKNHFTSKGRDLPLVNVTVATHMNNYSNWNALVATHNTVSSALSCSLLEKQYIIDE